MKQLPAEATGVYLFGLSLFDKDILYLTIAAVIGLILLIVMRWKARVSLVIWIMSIIGYFIWVYVVGDGPFQALFTFLHIELHPMFGQFLVFIYSTVVGIMTFRPPKSG